MWLGPFLIAVVMIFTVSMAWTGFIGAPWVPTSRKMVHKMLRMAEVGPGDVVYDLGCGDGRLIITAARTYGARAVGIEIDPLRYLWCQIMISMFGLRDSVRILYGNIFSKDLREADVVTCYLMQDTNNKLERKLNRELRPGTRVVSNTFTFGGMHRVRKDGDAMLYLANFSTISH